MAATLLSLAAFARSCWRTDEFHLRIVDDRRHARIYSLFSDRGRVGLRKTGYVAMPKYTYLDPKNPPPRLTVWRSSATPLSETTMIGAFGSMTTRAGFSTLVGAEETFMFAIPTPAIAGLAGAALIGSYATRRRARMLARVGKCRRCGYDLRATPGFCPECGPIDRSRRPTIAPAERYNPMVGATHFLTERTRDERGSASERSRSQSNA